MSRKMNQNGFAVPYAQVSPFSNKTYVKKQTENTINCPKNLTRPESFVCCPDIQTVKLDDSDSAYRVVNINLKDCAAKLWSNLVGNFNIESSTYLDNMENKYYTVNNVCDVPGCNYNRDKISPKPTMRSRSETSKYDYQKPRKRNVDVAKANRMKVALKCCLQEKIARSKICDNFLIEMQQVLARYPYTDLYFYWELLRAIQAEVDKHKCKKSVDEHEDQKLKQLYMLMYAITRLILQLDFITSGNSMFHLERSKSWSQLLNQLREDFRDPHTGQFSMNPFPRIASSLKASFQDGTNQQDLCSCLPLGFFSRAIGIAGSEGENNCLTLKVDCFPDDFTCFDLESLTYLLDNLNCDLQVEYSKGTSGKCQVANCPYPVPVRDERVIKELQSNARVIEQLISYLQRTKCYTVKVSPKRNCDKTNRQDKPKSCTVRSKSILKNRCNTVDNQTKVELATYQVQCPPSPKQNSTRSSRHCSPVKDECSRSNSPRLCVEKADALETNDNNVNLCCAEPALKIKISKKETPEQAKKRSRSGVSRSSPVCSEDEFCKKCNKANFSCRHCKEKKDRKTVSCRSSNSDRECDFRFCVKDKKKKDCGTNTTPAADVNTICKSNDADVLMLCCKADCEPKVSLISSVTKLVQKIDAKKPPCMCDPCNKLADKYKTQKCVEKLRKSSKTNFQINDCKHKKERIIRLVNLLSNNDCAFKPTNPDSVNNPCKSKFDEVCELYDKFLELEMDENVGKKKGCQADEPNCAEKLKMAFASMSRGKSVPNATNNSTCIVKRKASIGIQASTSQESCLINPPSKVSISISAECDTSDSKEAKQADCNSMISKRLSRASSKELDSTWVQPSKTDDGCLKELNPCSSLTKGLVKCSKDNLKDDSNSGQPLKTTNSDSLKQACCSKENLEQKPSEADVCVTKTGKMCRLANSKSIECLKKKIESKYRALLKQQQKIYEKKRKAAEKKRLKEQREQQRIKCFKCRVCKIPKSKFSLKDAKSNCMRCCKSKTNYKDSKSRSSLRSSKSVNNISDSKSACSVRGCKSKGCKTRLCKRVKSCSTEVFANKSDPCFSLDLPDDSCEQAPVKQPCASSKCKTKKKSKSLGRKSKPKLKKSSCKLFKQSDHKINKSDSKLKVCDAKLKKTNLKLKKSCSELKKCDLKLKKCDSKMKKCQSQLSHCDETKKKLEKCASILLKKVSQCEVAENC